VWLLGACRIREGLRGTDAEWVPGRAWSGGVSLSCLWSSGAKQATFPCAHLEGDTRPSPASLGCGRPDKRLVVLPPFPGNTWPDHGLRGPLAVWPVSTLAALSSVVRTLPGPAARPTHGGPRWMFLATAWSTLSRGGCCQAFPVPQIWTCSPASQQWGPCLQGEGALCQSRASALDFPWNPHALAPGSGHGAVLRKFSVNDV